MDAAKIAAWWAERFQIDDRREAFRAALVAYLEAHAGDAEIVLDVDYDPRGPMLEIVRSAGVDCRGCMYSADGILPRKTTMIVDSTGTVVKEGYGAPFEAI